jgi:hypothetical protein
VLRLVNGYLICGLFWLGCAITQRQAKRQKS